jgi:DNA topoisomerase-3
MSIAVVAEKPAVARDIARALGVSGRGDGVLSGGGYLITWAIGHLVRLAEPHEIKPEWKRWGRDLLPMLPGEWPTVVIPETRDQFEVVKRVLRSPEIDQVVCATDAGREGELIFRLLYEAAGCRKPVRRLWVSSLTDQALRDGFSRLRDGRVYDGLADAARGRSRADWLVGMNLSRAYGLSFDVPLSVGRVQTPTLAMVVERELAIRAFVPEDYLEVVATFSPRGGVSYPGTWFRPAGEHPRRLKPDGAEAKAIVARALSGAAAIESLHAETKKLAPPLLYDLTELQRHANRLYGFTAKRTLEVAQSLYEGHKLLSYPRTDSRHLTTEVAATLPAVVAACSGPYSAQLAPGTGQRPLSRRFVDDAQVGDHHAIIPTPVSPGARALSPEEAKIYDLVCRRLLQAWHGDYVWAATQVVTHIDSPGVVDRYSSHGTQELEPGWKVLDVGARKPPKTKGASEEEEGALPAELAQGQAQEVLDARAVSKKTRPPPRFTEAALLTAMETAGKQLDDRELADAMRECGLGTPATRAAIIETLLARSYLLRNGKALEATEKGIALVSVVDPEVKSPAMTGQWEAELAKIEKGQGQLMRFTEKIEQYVRDVVGRVPPRGSLPPMPGAGEGRFAPSAGGARPAEASLHSAGVRPGEGQASGQLLGSGRAPAARPSPGAGGGQPSSAPDGQRNLFGAREPGAAFNGAQSSNAEPGPRQRAPTPPAELGKLLKQTFGHDRFRPHQEAVCRAATEGKDLLLVMPTGAGKSLCYQLPGLARGGTTLVVSPLIALMEDQVSKLRALGLRAERIHSGRERTESRQVCADYLAGALDFLFIAPERLGVPGFPELLAKRKPSLIAVDEAHCISQWGHDFRPDYRLLGQRLPQLRPAPVIALTATATPTVQRDISAQLALGPLAFIHGFRRDNLEIEAIEVPPGERLAVAQRLLEDPARRPAILYAPTRKVAESVADGLDGRLRVAAYHAGLPAK